MTPTEEKRLQEATERAKTAAPEEHVDFKFKDENRYLCCRKCGHIKPHRGWPGPCRGWVQVKLRGEETPRG